MSEKKDNTVDAPVETEQLENQAKVEGRKAEQLDFPDIEVNELLRQVQEQMGAIDVLRAGQSVVDDQLNSLLRRGINYRYILSPKKIEEQYGRVARLFAEFLGENVGRYFLPKEEQEDYIDIMPIRPEMVPTTFMSHFDYSFVHGDHSEERIPEAKQHFEFLRLLFKSLQPVEVIDPLTGKTMQSKRVFVITLPDHRGKIMVSSVQRGKRIMSISNNFYDAVRSQEHATQGYEAERITKLRLIIREYERLLEVAETIKFSSYEESVRFRSDMKKLEELMYLKRDSYKEHARENLREALKKLPYDDETIFNDEVISKLEAGVFKLKMRMAQITGISSHMQGDRDLLDMLLSDYEYTLNRIHGQLAGVIQKPDIDKIQKECDVMAERLYDLTLETTPEPFISLARTVQSLIMRANNNENLAKSVFFLEEALLKLSYQQMEQLIASVLFELAAETRILRPIEVQSDLKTAIERFNAIESNVRLDKGRLDNQVAGLLERLDDWNSGKGTQDSEEQRKELKLALSKINFSHFYE